jgi:hypothetical protein
VLELHGWGELYEEMHGLSLRGEWAEMGARLPNEVVETIAVVAEPAGVRAALEARYDGLFTRCSLSTRADEDPVQWTAALSSNAG